MSALQLGLLRATELRVILLVLVVTVLPAYWVYRDATRRDDGYAALWAVLAGGLTLSTFVGGILTLVAYVWQR